MHRLLVLALALAACGRTVTMTDDIDLTWDFKLTPFDRYVNDLHSPYVLGTKMTLWVTSDDDHDNVRNWNIVSSDPGVLELSSQQFDGTSLGVSATALREGTVDLAVIDDHGERVGHGLAEVALPDAIEIDAHGYLIMGLPDRAPVQEARIASDDTATYLVRYFNQGRELYGNSVLTAQAPASVVAEPRTTFLFEKREWLTLTPTATGVSSVQLDVGGVHVGDVQVIGVSPSEITDVSIIGQSEKGAKDGEWLVLLAQATDAMGRNVFGVNYQWNVDGAWQTADGDLYRYEYKKGNTAMVVVERDNHTDAVDIQSDRGFVDNSNKIGCAAGGGGSLAGCVLVLGYCLRRRRSSTTASAPSAALPAPPSA